MPLSEPTSLGPRMGALEVNIGRHDERLKNIEDWVPKMQNSIDNINKSVYKLAGAFIVISIVAQLAFTLWGA